MLAGVWDVPLSKLWPWTLVYSYLVLTVYLVLFLPLDVYYLISTTGR